MVKLFLLLIIQHTVNTSGGVEIHFLTSTQDGGERLASRCSRFTPRGKRIPVSTGWAHIPSGHCGEH
jgi:hypothetical protein